MNGVRKNDSEFEVIFYLGQEVTQHIPDVSTEIRRQLILGIRTLKYVHELQTLWFGLLDDELIYNQGYMAQDSSEFITMD